MAVRSVYGWWLPSLAELDPTWTAAALDAILPLDPVLEPYRRTAWDTYQWRWLPGSTTFELLRDQYELAVRRAFELPEADADRRDRHAARLAIHIALLFIRGWVDQDGLPSLFLQLAPPTPRAVLMEYLGRMASDSRSVRDETVTRLRDFWEARDRSGVPEADRAGELRAFGWWFSSPDLDPDWAVATLLGVVHRTGRVDASWHVLEKLAGMASSHPREAVEIVRLLATGPDPDPIVGYDEHIKEILRAVLVSNNPEAEERATNLVHELGRRGYRDMRELLDSRNKP